MLAGLWDGTDGLLKGMQKQINIFFTSSNTIDRKVDQIFLGEIVWPSIRKACLSHNDYFDCFDARPYSPYGHLPRGHHIGMNVNVLPERERVPGLQAQAPA